jgi:hypothetical protein
MDKEQVIGAATYRNQTKRTAAPTPKGCAKVPQGKAEVADSRPKEPKYTVLREKQITISTLKVPGTLLNRKSSP